MRAVSLFGLALFCHLKSCISFKSSTIRSFSSTTLRKSLDDDEMDFEALKAQIDAMVPADIVSVEDVSVLPSPASSKANNSKPASSTALLKAMEKDSMAISAAVCNGKPTIVDFYADWCESCKAMAPAMRSLELKYRDSLNFITVDGANPKNGRMVGAFRVDAIPHVAFVTTSAEVKTALVGAVPQKILDDDMEALLKNAALPYEGYDAFEEGSHYPFGKYNLCPVEATTSTSQ